MEWMNEGNGLGSVIGMLCYEMKRIVYYVYSL